MKKFYENFVLRSTEDGGENNGGGNTNPNAGEGENEEEKVESEDRVIIYQRLVRCS